MFPPCAVDGPSLTIRKFTPRYSLDDLVDVGTLDGRRPHENSRTRSRPQQNILISGGTGTGKTTLLNALAAHIPDHDRIVLIEETSEIHLDKPNLLRFEARRAQAPSDRRRRCRLSPSRTSCAPRCDTVPIASSSARSVARKRSTCCRRSIPGISAA